MRVIIYFLCWTQGAAFSIFYLHFQSCFPISILSNFPFYSFIVYYKIILCLIVCYYHLDWKTNLVEQIKSMTSFNNSFYIFRINFSFNCTLWHSIMALESNLIPYLFLINQRKYYDISILYPIYKYYFWSISFLRQKTKNPNFY